MRPRPDPVGPGQESVWSYPRPAIAERCSAHIMIQHCDLIIADTRESIRTLETSHPPSYYIPPCDIAPGVIRPAGGGSLCEWKGEAIYWDVVVGDRVLNGVGWSYPNPSLSFGCCEIMSHSTQAHLTDAASIVKQLCHSPAIFTAGGSPARWQARSRERPAVDFGRQVGHDGYR